MSVLGCDNAEEPPQPPAIPATLEPPCELASAWYRITDIELPFTRDQADEFAFNLDLDSSGDTANQGGLVLSVLGAQYEEVPTQLAAAASAKLEGRVIWLIDVATCSDDSSPHARTDLRRGRETADGIVADPPGVPAVGERNGDRIVAAEGFGVVPVTLFADILDVADEILWVTADGMALDISHDGDDLTGRLGMGLPDALSSVASPLAAFYDAQLEGLDCAACYADDDGGLDCYVCQLDADRDGTISAAEIEADSIIEFLFNSDLDLFYEDPDDNEVYWPLHDYISDRLSFGLGFRAVPVDVAEL